MTEDEPLATRMVGSQRHHTLHVGRLVQDRIVILHSVTCQLETADLKNCAYSLALDKGVEPWLNMERAHALAISAEGNLVGLFEWAT